MKAFALAVAMLSPAASPAPPPAAAVFDAAFAEVRVTRALQREQFLETAVEAFDAMFALAGDELRKLGRVGEASTLEAGWREQRRLVFREDVGDHWPASEWVAVRYRELEAVFGVEFMEFSHLRDIWVLNHGLPVVLEPEHDARWCEEYEAEWTDGCGKEYERHLAGTRWVRGDDPGATAYLHGGVAGVVTYWSVWAACEAATWGGGSFWVCSPAATLAQIAVERYVAPPLAARVWERQNPPASYALPFFYAPSWEQTQDDEADEDEPALEEMLDEVE